MAFYTVDSFPAPRKWIELVYVVGDSDLMLESATIMHIIHHSLKKNMEPLELESLSFFSCVSPGISGHVWQMDLNDLLEVKGIWDTIFKYNIGKNY